MWLEPLAANILKQLPSEWVWLSSEWALCNANDVRSKTWKEPLKKRKFKKMKATFKPLPGCDSRILCHNHLVQTEPPNR